MSVNKIECVDYLDLLIRYALYKFICKENIHVRPEH